MKLRIKGDSLRLRVSPSDLERLISSGRVEETIHFGPGERKLTYALELLEHSPDAAPRMTLRYLPQEIAVVIPGPEARRWAEGADVGLYGEAAAGECRLELAVEKDFRCLVGDDRENEDAFPNPAQGAAC